MKLVSTGESVWRYQESLVRPRLEELKANMTDSITLAIKSMDRETQGQRMIIEIPT